MEMIRLSFVNLLLFINTLIKLFYFMYKINIVIVYFF